eukprot:1157748-Pelagomonas_calceolata.AAC.4
MKKGVRKTKRKSKHKSIFQQIGPHHGTYDTTVRHCLTGPVQRAQDPPLSLTHALQHPSMGPPLPYESQ